MCFFLFGGGGGSVGRTDLFSFGTLDMVVDWALARIGGGDSQEVNQGSILGGKPGWTEKGGEESSSQTLPAPKR